MTCWHRQKLQREAGITTASARSFQQALCVEHSYLVLSVPCYHSYNKKMANSQQFRVCVHPCPHYIMGRDIHDLCVCCLEVEHVRSALEGAGCVHCEALRSRLAVFEKSGQARAPRKLGPLHCLRRLQPFLSPHALDPLLKLGIRKPSLWLLPP